MRITRWVLVVQVLFSAGARAEDAAADRAEMDLAAGRAMFQNSPLSDRIVEIRPVVVPGAVEPTPDLNRRRAVRVVLPSPYQRR
jgi:hypothetical protein